MKNKFKIYIAIELMLYIALLILQIIYINKGYALTNSNNDLFIAIGIMHIAITFISLIYATYLFFNNKERIKEDLFLIYFIFIFIGDLFFSIFIKYNFIGHIGFLLAYILLMYIRKSKIYEYICSLGLGLLAFIYLLITKKLTIAFGIDSFLGSFLIMNMISSIIKYVKTKDKAYLIIMLAAISIFLSDLSIAVAALSKNITLINTFSLIVWPTYILGCILLNGYYTLRKEKV